MRLAGIITILRRRYSEEQIQEAAESLMFDTDFDESLRYKANITVASFVRVIEKADEPLMTYQEMLAHRQRVHGGQGDISLIYTAVDLSEPGNGSDKVMWRIK